VSSTEVDELIDVRFGMYGYTLCGFGVQGGILNPCTERGTFGGLLGHV